MKMGRQQSVKQAELGGFRMSLRSKSALGHAVCRLGTQPRILAAIQLPAKKVPRTLPRLDRTTTKRMRLAGFFQNPRTVLISFGRSSFTIGF